MVGNDFRQAEAARRTGVAAMARAGARIIIDDVFLDGGGSQERMRAHLTGLTALWAGVRGDAEIATGREIARGTGRSGWQLRRRSGCTPASPDQSPATTNDGAAYSDAVSGYAALGWGQAMEAARVVLAATSGRG